MESNSEGEFPPALLFSLFALIAVVFYALFSRNFRLGLNHNMILLQDQHESQPYKAPAVPAVRVFNPFYLEMDDKEASTLHGGVKILIKNERPCTVTCYWGMDIEPFYRILYSRKEMTDISRLLSQQALETSDAISLDVSQETTGRRVGFKPVSPREGLGLGAMPRSRYPLVITLANPDQYHRGWDQRPTQIVCLVSVLHLPDEEHQAPAFCVALLALTNTGSVSQLKQLYVSGGKPSPGQPAAADCVVCQSGEVERALLPCRHACVCDRCFPHLTACPMCRYPIISYLCLAPPRDSDGGEGDDEQSQGGGAEPAVGRLEALCTGVNRWLGLD